eukprot:NODE_663_length_683_cov_373.890288_g654_i0.p1 GENE.NODE_663_length_683_cov_373.890288_g654_i0~~NODE_663_length_683_cov_373.890288_g654_i0.p1  ORF type:complete len:109 (-),score=26.56 NODE_663_length_683_cov_373.890288_g654_i0:276-602(-)
MREFYAGGMMCFGSSTEHILTLQKTPSGATRVWWKRKTTYSGDGCEDEYGSPTEIEKEEKDTTVGTISQDGDLVVRFQVFGEWQFVLETKSLEARKVGTTQWLEFKER